MATTLYLRDLASDLTVGTDTTKALKTTRGAASATAVTNTVAGPVTPPTTATQVTKTAGGSRITWLSDPVAGFTLSGTVTVNIRGLESATQANATSELRLSRYNSSGAWVSDVLAVPPGTIPAEWTTADSAHNTTPTPTSTTFSTGDRIGVQLYIDDGSAVTMASGRTVTNSYDGPTAGAAGDTFITLTETVTFITAGTGSVALSALAVSGSGAEIFSGSGAVTLSALAVTGSGTSGNPIAGTGSVALSSLAVSGSGVEAFIGTASVAFGSLAVSGSGTSGSAVSDIPSLTMMGGGGLGSDPGVMQIGVE